ncbi:MAG: dTDP-glucose 4,6-dehydratase [Ruminococcus sp.]|nr:dTDP-glucose 4,6-dehydratase [Ruminococcus sp.]
MKLLVTGGAGFIGSNFISYMLSVYNDCEIICLDKLTYAGSLDNLSDALDRTNFKFVKGDICDKETVCDIFDREHPDAVVNFAAESHVDRSIESPDVFIKTNILGAGILLDACLGFGCTRFHQISTDEVYGDLPLDCADLSFSEDYPLHPSSPYSSSKAGADLLVLSYYKTYGLNVTISRCGNNYGFHQHTEKLIPKTIENALRDKPIPIYGAGLNVRDWIHVLDHCRAIDVILKKGRAGEVYNVGARNRVRNIDLVKYILKELGKSDSLINFVTDRKGHDRLYAVDPGKLERELSWKAEIEFEQGLRDTIEWYVQHL